MTTTLINIIPRDSLSHEECDESIGYFITEKTQVILVDVSFKQVSSTKIKTFQGQEITVKDGTTREPIRIKTDIQIPLLSKDEEEYQRSLCRHMQSRYGIDSDACSHVVKSLTDYAQKIQADRGTDDEAKVFIIKGNLGPVKEFVCEERVPNELGIESSCAICLDVLSIKGGCTRTPCSHIFHDCCFFTWLFRNNTCPLCRKIIRS